jgi:hypothetical protein
MCKAASVTISHGNYTASVGSEGSDFAFSSIVPSLLIRASPLSQRRLPNTLTLPPPYFSTTISIISSTTPMLSPPARASPPPPSMSPSRPCAPLDTAPAPPPPRHLHLRQPCPTLCARYAGGSWGTADDGMAA